MDPHWYGQWLSCTVKGMIQAHKINGIYQITYFERYVIITYRGGDSIGEPRQAAWNPTKNENPNHSCHHDDPLFLLKGLAYLL